MSPVGYTISNALRSASFRKQDFRLRVAILCLLLLSMAAAAFAEENLPVVANLGKESVSRKKSVAQPRVIEKYDYYEVGGGCEKDILCDLKQKCVKWDDGKNYDSVTSWKVKWDYGYDRAPQTCSPDSFRVTVAITFRLPKWTRPPDAPQQLIDKWDTYMKNLVAHENGHRDMAVEAASELSQAVAELPPALTCDEIDREVQKLSRARMAKLRADEKGYDTSTHHGHTQGAVFP
jgi:predicted secreted Zn-dependent protease